MAAFGYNPIIDTAVVLGSTLLTARLLMRAPQRLLYYLPTLLSLFFVLPVVTNLTNWHIVPMLIVLWWLHQGRSLLPRRAQATLIVLILAFAGQVVYALYVGDAGLRVLLRTSYYVGLLALFAFSYEMTRRPGGLELLLKGLVLAAMIHSLYSIYQIAAQATGLPYRAIIRGFSPVGSIAFEGPLLRVNGFANEPKRLGYILALGAMAALALSKRTSSQERRRQRWKAAFIFSISIMTFSGSYFVALGLLAIGAILIYPSLLKRLFPPVLVIATGLILFSSKLDPLWSALQEGYDQRTQEVEVGIDGDVVYRQEFFAEDYLRRHPVTAIFGTGMGRYNIVLRRQYGEGVGLGEGGRVLPLNSNFFELIFDLGGIATAIFYAAVAVMIFQLRRIGTVFLASAVMFLAFQSLTIQVLQFSAIILGAAMAVTQPAPRSAFAIPRNRPADGSTTEKQMVLIAPIQTDQTQETRL